MSEKTKAKKETDGDNGTREDEEDDGEVEEVIADYDGAE